MVFRAKFTPRQPHVLESFQDGVVLERALHHVNVRVRGDRDARDVKGRIGKTDRILFRAGDLDDARIRGGERRVPVERTLHERDAFPQLPANPRAVEGTPSKDDVERPEVHERIVEREVLKHQRVVARAGGLEHSQSAHDVGFGGTKSPFRELRQLHGRLPRRSPFRPAPIYWGRRRRRRKGIDEPRERSVPQSRGWDERRRFIHHRHHHRGDELRRWRGRCGLPSHHRRRRWGFRLVSASRCDVKCGGRGKRLGNHRLCLLLLITLFLQIVIDPFPFSLRFFLGSVFHLEGARGN